MKCSSIYICLIVAAAFFCCCHNGLDSNRDQQSEMRVQVVPNDSLAMKIVSEFARQQNVTPIIEETFSPNIDNCDIVASYVPQTNMKGYAVDNVKTFKIILLQRRGRNRISLISEIPDSTTIGVAENSIAELRLKNLKQEYNLDFNILQFPDSIDLAQMIEDRQLDYAATTDIYYNHLEHRSLDSSLELSIDYFASWRTNNQELAKSLSECICACEVYCVIQNKAHSHRKTSSISNFDALFKQYAVQLDWDWRLLAAIAKVESNFNPEAAGRGTVGLMQISKTVAAKYRDGDMDILNPQNNIYIATCYLKRLQMIFNSVDDKEEQIRFVLAAYNAGHAHIIDAIDLADYYGLNQKIWRGNVQEMLKNKSNPTFYNNEICKRGRFNAKPTIKYVDKVLNTYEIFVEKYEL